MPAFRAFPRILVSLALLLALASCDPASRSVPPSVSSTGTPSVFVYEGFGVRAALSLGEEDGRLEVTNGTGGDLGVPRVWVLDAAEGRRIELATEEPEGVAGGADASFTVTWPSEAPEVGMVFLAFGEDGYGAFEPTEART